MFIRTIIFCVSYGVKKLAAIMYIVAYHPVRAHIVSGRQYKYPKAHCDSFTAKLSN